MHYLYRRQRQRHSRRGTSPRVRPLPPLAVHREIPGSGLGLYFAKTMVEQQQGRIWVESEVGTGSRFYVLLKRAQRRIKFGSATNRQLLHQPGRPPT